MGLFACGGSLTTLRSVCVCVSLAAPRSCAGDQLRCGAGGGCVSRAFVCDGERDCEDGADEAGCPPPPPCPPHAFRCNDSSCVSPLWACDGDRDCPDGSDEWPERCGAPRPPRRCPPLHFACGSGRCIPRRWRCDGSADCPDRSDEEGCGGSPGEATRDRGGRRGGAGVGWGGGMRREAAGLGRGRTGMLRDRGCSGMFRGSGCSGIRDGPGWGETRGDAPGSGRVWNAPGFGVGGWGMGRNMGLRRDSERVRDAAGCRRIRDGPGWGGHTHRDAPGSGEGGDTRRCSGMLRDLGGSTVGGWMLWDRGGSGMLWDSGEGRNTRGAPGFGEGLGWGDTHGGALGWGRVWDAPGFGVSRMGRVGGMLQDQGFRMLGDGDGPGQRGDTKERPRIGGGGGCSGIGGLWDGGSGHGDAPGLGMIWDIRMVQDRGGGVGWRRQDTAMLRDREEVGGGGG